MQIDPQKHMIEIMDYDKGKRFDEIYDLPLAEWISRIIVDELNGD